MAVTIADLAREAGVSKATVSLVLNDRRTKVPISKATKQRVLQVAETLGYSPNAAARALSTRRTNTVGFICHDITDPLMSMLAREVQSALEPHGYTLLLCSAARELEKASLYARLLQEKRVDGIIVAGGIASDLQGDAGRFQSAGVPLIAAGMLVEDDGNYTAYAMNDHIEGGRQVGRHLASLGHRHVGFLAARGISFKTSERRLQGLREGLAESGIAVAEDDVEWGEANTAEEGAAAARRLLARAPALTALFAYNDWMALGAMQAAAEAGRRIPADLSLAGYGDLPYSPYTVPPLTTVHTPMDEVGQIAVEMLIHLLQKEPLSSHRVMVRPTLLPRDSTAAPRKT